VAKGRIVIIAQDEWESTLLAKFLAEADYAVHLEGEARLGFEKVRELEPDCILCDVNLPDIDGFWVARRVRTEPTRLAATPFIFLLDAGDTQSRLQGLNVGADLHLIRPFHDEEVVAQVSALLEMAKRLRSVPGAFSGESPGPRAAVQGDIAQMSVATVLTLLDLERRTGQLSVRSDSGRVGILELNEGALTEATLDGARHDSTALLRELLRWQRGSFSFHGAIVAAPSGARQKIGGLLIDAVRQEDESRR
jgi:two-component system OmpR family response regulator